MTGFTFYGRINAYPAKDTHYIFAYIEECIL